MRRFSIFLMLGIVAFSFVSCKDEGFSIIDYADPELKWFIVNDSGHEVLYTHRALNDRFDTVYSHLLQDKDTMEFSCHEFSWTYNAPVVTEDSTTFIFDNQYVLKHYGYGELNAGFSVFVPSDHNIFNITDTTSWPCKMETADGRPFYHRERGAEYTPLKYIHYYYTITASDYQLAVQASGK